jgi:hypothetical protein
MTHDTNLLARYRHLREIGLKLNTLLVKTLSESELDEGGKKLGILKKKKVLVMDSEDVLSVLMDYCLHDVRRDGKTAVERFLTESPPAPGSEDMLFLEAKRQSRFSLFAVESAEPGVGVHVRDLLLDEPLFLVDIGFSRSMSIGMVLASRIMTMEGMTMTTGAALPVGVLSRAEQSAYVSEVERVLGLTDFRHLSPQQASELTTMIIRTCLREGAAEHIKYQDPSGVSRPSRPLRRVGPNERCPCGSGRKFKNCCGAGR